MRCEVAGAVRRLKDSLLKANKRDGLGKPSELSEWEEEEQAEKRESY